jgi:hypothetical protein
MGRKLTGCRISEICKCGAVAMDAAGVCEKCRFRARWLRRKRAAASASDNHRYRLRPSIEGRR